MDIKYLTPLAPEFVSFPNLGRHWRLTKPFEFSVDGERFAVPTDFWTDFASVPRTIWPIISPYDLGVGPVPHDFGYFSGHANKAYWDLVFLACMEKDGIANWKRQAAYRAVEWFGGATWDRYRRSNKRMILSDGAPGQRSILNWGLRHHVRQDLEPLKLSRLQADWLGLITMQTSS
jgi:hypothetical protein